MTENPVGNQVFIRNNRVARTNQTVPLTVDSVSLSASTRHALQTKLSATSDKLTRHLGCIPSSGLTTVICLSGLANLIHVDCMPLIPCLERPSDLSSRKPLACAFHNWLGERRVAMGFPSLSTPTLVKWPGLHLPDDCDGEELHDPFQRLVSAFDEKLPSTCIRGELQTLSTACNNSWLESLSPSKLEQIETQFFLSRDTQCTNKWWLYDNEASKAIDRILKRLVWCQQALAK